MVYLERFYSYRMYTAGIKKDFNHNCIVHSRGLNLYFTVYQLLWVYALYTHPSKFFKNSNLTPGYSSICTCTIFWQVSSTFVCACLLPLVLLVVIETAVYVWCLIRIKSKLPHIQSLPYQWASCHYFWKMTKRLMQGSSLFVILTAIWYIFIIS